MVRMSGLSATISKLRKSIDLSNLTSPSREVWMKWVSYESLKRYISITYYFINLLDNSHTGLCTCSFFSIPGAVICPICRHALWMKN